MSSKVSEGVFFQTFGGLCPLGGDLHSMMVFLRTIEILKPCLPGFPVTRRLDLGSHDFFLENQDDLFLHLESVLDTDTFRMPIDAYRRFACNLHG